MEVTKYMISFVLSFFIRSQGFVCFFCLNPEKRIISNVLYPHYCINTNKNCVIHFLACKYRKAITEYAKFSKYLYNKGSSRRQSQSICFSITSNVFDGCTKAFIFSIKPKNCECTTNDNRKPS